MPRSLWVAALVAGALGGWYLYTHYEVVGLQGVKLRPRAPISEGGRKETPAPGEPPVPDRLRSIRIASFNINPLDEQKLNQPAVAARLVQVIQKFDIVAIQDVQAPNQGVVVRLVEQVNAGGRHYDFAVPPSVGRDPVEQYSALLFDRATVEIDRRTVYSVDDPTGQLRRKPLVASFRARGADPADAFTFTLINVHVSPDQLSTELELLDDVFRAVRDDGRNEDDIIMLGDLGTDDRHLGQLARVPYLACCIVGVPSTVQAKLVDNVLFDRRATVEFTGRSGVLDVMRQWNLSAREIVQISNHFPVWAEFSIYEGGQAGPIAETPTNEPR